MNSKHRKTLKAVFAEPTQSSIAWADIEALLISIGCKVSEGSGSRVRFVALNQSLAVHRPHPQKETKQYVVREIRAFLTSVGVTP